MHWDALINEISNKVKNSKTNVLFSQEESVHRQIRKKIKYFIGVQHCNIDIYFTNREAEVMVELLQGKTISAVAAGLNLSPRTIEFYVKNMKTKLACRTKSELIGKVFASDFVKNVEILVSRKED